MNKHAGTQIAIKFTESLTGDVTGLLPEPLGSEFITPPGEPSASSQYSSYNPDNAFDGNTSTYWYTRTTGAQWIQIKLTSPIKIKGFRWYIGSSYRPNAFVLYGSNDGENWTTLYSGSSENATGWKDFSFDWTGKYLYYRWEITSRHSTYLYIYEIELLKGYGNEKALTVTGQEYLYTQGPNYNGSLIDTEYEVDTVEMHPTEEKTLRLTMKGLNEFNSVVGKLTVAYDALIGTLAGKGGAVESFEKEFTPEELVATPNPGVTETIAVAPVAITAELIPVEFLDAFAEETITVAPVSVTGTLIPIEDLNP